MFEPTSMIYTLKENLVLRYTIYSVVRSFNCHTGMFIRFLVCANISQQWRQTQPTLSFGQNIIAKQNIYSLKIWVLMNICWNVSIIFITSCLEKFFFAIIKWINRDILISRQKKVWCKMESANIEINRSIWCYYSRAWFWKNCHKLLSQWQLVHKYQRYWCWKWKLQWFDHKFGKYNLIS